MVTGDHPITAAAIAKSVFIITSDNKTLEEVAQEKGIPEEDVNPSDVKAAVIHGSKLKEMSANDIDDILANHE